MAKVLKKLGRLHCHCCGKLVVLRQQGNGLPIYMCNECDYKGQAFSEDSGQRMIASCVDRFGDAANDGNAEGATLAGKPGANANKSAAPDTPDSVPAAVPPKRLSLGSALAAAFD